MGWTSEVRACFVRGDRLRIGFSIAGRSRVAERVWIVADAEAEEEPVVKGCELSAGRETNTIVYCYDSIPIHYTRRRAETGLCRII